MKILCDTREQAPYTFDRYQAGDGGTGRAANVRLQPCRAA